jgi:hypothetical protein
MCYNYLLRCGEETSHFLASATLPPCRSSLHASGCPAMRRDRTSHAARGRTARATLDRTFRPCRKGSAFLPVGPCANPSRPPNSARRAQLDTLESSQPLSLHALAHSFRHTWGWGSVLATNHSPLATILLFSYSYALFYIEQSRNSFALNKFRTLWKNTRGGGCPIQT